MFKKFAINILTCLSILSCSNVSDNLNNSRSTFINNTNNYKLIASLPEENIQLYGQSPKSKEESNYQDLMLMVDGKTKKLEWTNVISATFAPQLISADMNKDGVKELVIILTTGTGSDFHIEEVHVLNPSNFYEIKVVNPLNIVRENVIRNITKNNNNVLISITVKGHKTEIIKDIQYTPVWFDNVGFGQEIHWRVSDNKLYADLGAQVSPAGFVGTVIIEYTFRNDAFGLKDIRFIVI